MDIARRQKLQAFLIAFGASILLARTTIMLAQGALGILVPWVGATLVLEFVLDLATVVFALHGLMTGRAGDRLPTFRLAIAITVLHALRVAIFVAGRFGPWRDFDVRPELRAGHDARWEWWQVWFAGTLSLLSIIVLVAIWIYLRRRALDRQAR